MSQLQCPKLCQGEHASSLLNGGSTRGHISRETVVSSIEGEVPVPRLLRGQWLNGALYLFENGVQDLAYFCFPNK